MQYFVKEVPVLSKINYVSSSKAQATYRDIHNMSKTLSKLIESQI